MTGINFAALVRKYTGTNTSSLPDAELVLLANTVKDDLAPDILAADNGLFGAISTQDLVASTTSINSREYPLPARLLQIRYIEALFDSTQRYVKLLAFNSAKNLRPRDEDTILNTYANVQGSAYYEIFRNAVWIYSGTILPVTDGFRIFYIAYPAEISAGDLASSQDLSTDPSSTTSQLPRQFHELWARRVSILWKGSKDKPLPLSGFEQNFDRDLKRKLYALFNGNADEEILGALPYDDGSQY